MVFLLEGQVMQVADATTPLRQLYFIVQLMLMSPHGCRGRQGASIGSSDAPCVAVCENPEMLRGLEAIDELVEAKRYFEALAKRSGRCSPSSSRSWPAPN